MWLCKDAQGRQGCDPSSNALRVKSLELEIRAGLHTGEIHLVGDDIEGVSVHIACRIASLARGSQVVVSRTLKDPIAGSGLTLADYGTHVLKGIPDEWQLYLVES